jgi:hypothetical protein
VQVFGTRKSADTRKALRFFSERRIKVHFVDLAERAASPGELRRFVAKFGVAALVDQASRRFGELGLTHARYSDTGPAPPAAGPAWQSADRGPHGSGVARVGRRLTIAASIAGD